MTNGPEEPTTPLSDDDITSTESGSAPQQGLGGDADGTDGSDADGTDGTDGDSTDSSDGDSSDADGTDADGTDGTDGPEGIAP